MDPLRLHAYKIHAIKKHKRQQFVGTLLLYSISALACTLLCCSPLWYPPFCATFNLIFFLFLPNICSFFFTTKVLFVVGNLIVIFLVGESKFFAGGSHDSSYIDVCYNKQKCSPQVLAKKERRAVTKCPLKVVGGGEAKACEEERRGDEGVLVKGGLEGIEVNLGAEEVNKMADDFIARINRQRRNEAESCRG